MLYNEAIHFHFTIKTEEIKGEVAFSAPHPHPAHPS